MAFDPSVEPPIPLGQVPRLPWLPARRRGKKLHVATAFRWSSSGLKAPGGQPVRLETIRVGGTLCTSEAALVRFFSRLSGETPPPAETTESYAKVGAALDAAGF